MLHVRVEKDLNLSGEGIWHYCFVSKTLAFFKLLNVHIWICEVHVNQTKSKTGLEKRTSGGKGILMVFKTPRKNEKAFRTRTEL